MLPVRSKSKCFFACRAKQAGVKVNVVHNASIMNAIGCCGLSLYNFGATVSIVFFDGNWRPDSFYDKIKANKQLGLHTLCLLGNAHCLKLCVVFFFHLCAKY